MIATDLMIGDWVSLINIQGKKANVRILTLAEGGSSTCEEVPEEGSCVYCTYNNERFEPIPLTPEILENNGFTMSNCKSRKPWQIVRPYLYCSWLSNRLNIRYGAKCPMQEVHLECKYVHELQHILRMVGVEKEVIL